MIIPPQPTQPTAFSFADLRCATLKQLSKSLSQVVVTTFPQYYFVFLLYLINIDILFTFINLRFFGSQNPFKAARFCLQKWAAC